MNKHTHRVPYSALPPPKGLVPLPRIALGYVASLIGLAADWLYLPSVVAWSDRVVYWCLSYKVRG